MNFNQIFQRISAFTTYQLKAGYKGGHGIHSPFCYYFVTEVLEENKAFYAYSQLRKMREQLKHDHSLLQLSDAGTGLNNISREVCEVLKNSSVSEKYGQLLFRIAEVFNAKRILELGTSLGVSSAYLAKADSHAKVVSIDSCAALANYAKKLHQANNIQNVEVINGLFDEVLDYVLKEKGSFDLIYIDGNHTYDSTVLYVKKIMQYSSSQIVIVLDDIHWSKGMERAWNEIVAMPEVRLSMDLFRMGILFYNPELQKEHFVIRF